MKPKEQMPARLQGEVAKAERRNARRPQSPGVVLDGGGKGLDRYAPPHADLEAWEVQILDAFGTRSLSAGRSFLNQLGQLCTGRLDDADKWRPNEVQLNAALAFVVSQKPRTEAEAALAAQMFAVHLMTMRAASQALGGNQIVSQLNERTAAIAGKLARTFAIQCDTMAKLKGKRAVRQKITVQYERHDHKHVHFPTGGPDGHGSGQPHGKQDADASFAAMPGDEPGGNVLRLPCRDGQTGLPDSRRQKSRRSKGQG